MILFRRYRFSLPLAVGLLVLGLIVISQFSGYNQHGLLETFKSAYHQGTGSFMSLSKHQITKNQLIFPYKFPVKKEGLKEYMQKNPKSFNSTELKKPSIVKAKYENINENDVKNNPITNELLKSNFKSHNISIFHSSKNTNLDLTKCNNIAKTFDQTQINDPVNVQVSLNEMLTKILNQASTDPYLKELSPFFIDELELQLKYNVVDRFWYRLAGSSVWLEQYQVHFMISRILYSPKGTRNSPILSFTYAQIFDKDWKELVNSKLVVPTNNEKSMDDDDNEDSKIFFKTMSFPQVLNIPFWHDYDNIEGKYYGPEDPRLLLTKNSKGYEEPLIIFNAYHRKLSHFDDDVDDHVLMKTEFFRSMFMCWPWQTQSGKENTDGISNAEYDNRIYNKVVELKIKNLPRQKKQKNWTPFISIDQRSKNGFDKTINFIYRWANLEILKCDLVGDTGLCSFTYRLDNNLSPQAQIGPLRGGTQLMNVRSILNSRNDIDLDKIIPPNREVWIGFARAHLDDCGCGNNMYRPNLVIIVKDTVDVEIKELTDKPFKQPKDFYKISHISSSISFDIPIIGWDLMNPKKICVGSNVLIPNGISSWSIESFDQENSKDNWILNDYMTLSLSISDFTVHKIDVKGLLSQILNEKSLFYSPSSNNEKLLNQPTTKVVSDPERDLSKSLNGYNNDNVVCALEGSTRFCEQYGKDEEKNYEDHSRIYDDLENSLTHAKSSHHYKSSKGEEVFYEEELNEELETDIDKYEKQLELLNIEKQVENFPSNNKKKKSK